MLISWDWISEYVKSKWTAAEAADRLTMSGLNLGDKGIEKVGNDECIDVEVTSNRPDCLGHIGVAREIAALQRTSITVPDPQPKTGGAKVSEAISLENLAHDLCPKYIARVVRGVKIGPSPKWLKSRLETIGITSINNVVDVTNYVLMECGQPLHAFDLKKLSGPKIVVRPAAAGEKITAIDQREYTLTPGMCVIADATKPVAIAGVMGGLDTEISNSTVDVLIETAAFQPLSIRNTARALKLHSDSSYRFERGVDLEQLDWASRRCCELILQVAGGELLSGSLEAGVTESPNREAVTLRYAQIERVLGIPVSKSQADEILASLGLTQTGKGSADHATFSVPSWRRDLTREADLIEEVARVYGYEHIPDDAPISVIPSTKSLADRVSDRARDALTSVGLFECISLSFVDQLHHELFTPHPGLSPLSVDHSTRRQENLLRQSLIPSLLQIRRDNEKQGRFQAALFELGKVYLSADKSLPENEAEPRMIGMVCGGDLRDIKGVLETLAGRISRAANMETRPVELPTATPGRAAELFLDGKRWGWVAELARESQDRIDLRDTVWVAEVRISTLIQLADLTPRYEVLPKHPAMERDFNFVLKEAVHWTELEQVVKSAAGPLLESVRFVDQYRGKQIPAGCKSYVISAAFRSAERTLTSAEVDESQARIIAECQSKLEAVLR